MKMNENFMKTITALTDASDLMIEISDNERPPQAFIARAMRTIIDPSSKAELKYKDEKELLYNVLQMVIELIIFNPIDVDWVVRRNSCIPTITESEKKSIEEFINKTREINGIRY